MALNVEVYDLGEADRTVGQQRTRPLPRPTIRQPRRLIRTSLDNDRVALFVTDITRSLSVFAPGASQLVRGRVSSGIFFLASLVFMVALSSAVLQTMDRLAPTLELLGYSIAVAFWTLGIAFALAAALHIAAVWTSFAPVSGERPPRHPVVPAVASVIVPGWGQVLNGDRLRAALFLAGCWFVAGVWIIASPAATELFNAYVPIVSPWEQSARMPLLIWTLKWTAPLLLWALAVYDAATSAAGRRRSH